MIKEGFIRPDSKRLRPPRDSNSLSRCLGFFSYYSQWIHEFPDRTKPLTGCKPFTLPSEAVWTFEDLGKMVEKSFVTAIDEIIPFEVETDASEVALMANVSKPVAFFSASLQGSLLNHAAIERVAKAIIAAASLETFSDGATFHLKNRLNDCVIHVQPTPQSENKE